MFRFELWLYELEDFAEENTFPSVVQAAPTGDAMKIRSYFGLRERAEFFPG